MIMSRFPEFSPVMSQQGSGGGRTGGYQPSSSYHPPGSQYPPSSVGGDYSGGLHYAGAGYGVHGHGTHATPSQNRQPVLRRRPCVSAPVRPCTHAARCASARLYPVRSPPSLACVRVFVHACALIVVLVT